VALEQVTSIDMAKESCPAHLHEGIGWLLRIPFPTEFVKLLNDYSHEEFALWNTSGGTAEYLWE
jgi:hypothetical protein